MFNHHSLRKHTKTNMASRDPESHMLLVLISGLVLLSTTTNAIGVNYGTLANNLPAPTAVANFLKTKTIIDRVKLYDANPDIIRAFANTNIFVTITAANGDIPGLVNAQTAQQWVDTHIKPFYPATNINRVLVGNEILHSLDSNLINNLVPAMKSLHAALVASGFGAIQVTTPHSLGILLPTEVPSEGKFRPGWDVGVLAPMLAFLRETKSCFMVNPYPYFGYNSTTLNFALFNPNGGVVDKNSKLKYTSLFDNNMDQVYSAMNVLGYKDVGVCIGETGWPSAADNNQLGVSIADAQTYNGNLYKHVTSRIGTPLMPNRKFETFIFALFNENLKPGPLAERNFGLFEPDFTPVYDIGLMRGAAPGKVEDPSPSPSPESHDSSPSPPSPSSRPESPEPSSSPSRPDPPSPNPQSTPSSSPPSHNPPSSPPSHPSLKPSNISNPTPQPKSSTTNYFSCHFTISGALSLVVYFILAQW